MSLTKVSSAVLNVDDLYGFRNRIINGDMRIDQRNAGAAVTVNANAFFFDVDRFAFIGQASDGVFTAQQLSAGSPSGFTNYMRATVTTADTSLGSDQFYNLFQNIEGFNVADFGLGSSAAQTFTLSFWVRSSLTGTFGGSFRNSALNRVYPFTYTINSANTWEYKTLTIAGDTSGTWVTNNGIGLRISWSLGAGTNRKAAAGSWQALNVSGANGETAWISTAGATWDITGVQLEKGTVATPFERRPFGMELALCQRYCYVIRGDQGNGSTNGIGSGVWNGADGSPIVVNLPVPLRVFPSSITVSSASHFQVVREAIAWETATELVYATDATGPNICTVVFLTAIRDTRGFASRARTINTSATLAFNAEL
jgi:hypothetical protein